MTHLKHTHPHSPLKGNDHSGPNESTDSSDIIFYILTLMSINLPLNYSLTMGLELPENEQDFLFLRKYCDGRQSDAFISKHLLRPKVDMVHPSLQRSRKAPGLPMNDRCS